MKQSHHLGVRTEKIQRCEEKVRQAGREKRRERDREREAWRGRTTHK